jgi:hypothetical protein
MFALNEVMGDHGVVTVCARSPQPQILDTADKMNLRGKV